MNDEQLIHSLVKDLSPVRRLPSPNWRVAIWGSLAVASSVLGIQLFGVRADWLSKLHDTAYLREQLVVAALFALAGRATFAANIPGASPVSPRRALPFLALGMWLAFILCRAPLTTMVEPPGSGLGCVLRILCLAALPLLALRHSLRCGAPFHARRIGALAALAASAIAVIGTQLICAKDGAQHVLIWHFIPLICAGAFGAVWPTYPTFNQSSHLHTRP